MYFLKKSLGQNFLIDKNIKRKIVNLTKINGKNVIEIGPGDGSLTEEILKQNPKSLIAVEKDFNLVKKLKEKFSLNKNIKIINQDILNLDIEKYIQIDTLVFGNLPYNISSQILIKFIKIKNWPPNFSNIVFMFQKELGEKIKAKYKSSEYGRLSIITNLRLKIINTFLVSKNSFFPKPKVTSMILHFKPKKNIRFKIKKIDNLEKITNIFFSNKRKMINKNLKKILSKNQIKNLNNLSLESRPSDIKPDLYYKITELFEKN